LPEYQSPQNETPTGRLLIAFLAVMIFLAGYQFVLKKYGPPPQKPQTQQETASTQPQQSPAPASSVVPSAVATKSGKGTPAAVPTRQASAEAETVIENDLYKITFTNRGAQVKSWVLKQYSDDKGKPLDLVHVMAAQQLSTTSQPAYPLSLWTYDENLRKKLGSVLYVVSENTPPSPKAGEDGAPAGLNGAKKLIAFEYADGETTVRKSFTFDESYIVKVDTVVTQNGAGVEALTVWPAGFGDETVHASYAAQSVDYAPLHPGKKWWGGTKEVERHSVKDVSGANTIRNPFFWAGAADQYFAAIFLPDDPANASLVTLRNTIKVPKNLDKPDPNETIDAEVIGAAVGHTTGHTSLRLFAGPKDLKLLDTIKPTPVAGLNEQPPDLGSLIDLGTFGFFARPLFVWLRWTNQHIGNWGWSIVVVTIIINLALLPLRLSSMKSSLKTAKIQPQIKAIRDKYGKIPLRDPRRAEANRKIQEETAALMKEHGVNPVGGCLPLLIQLPFLWAFYSMLGNLIELRHAHWFYIHDLSGPDPWHILPVLIVLSTWVVQKMTPQGGMDPQQQKMMNLMMPVMLGFISINLSAGLCLYWVVGNIVAMLMQVGLNRTELGREQRELAAKRARKQALKV
jgi:YidC/Oxa1 family membrane protein insertase